MKCFDEYIKVNWQENYINLETGIRMAYTVCGPENGIPLVLIHGVTDGRISWAQVAPMLADLGYRVYVPEYRGNGKTDKPPAGPEGYTVEVHTKDMIAFFNALQIEKAHIAGHSLGSLICQRLNIEIPDRILSTILIESAAKCIGNPVLTWAHDGDGESYLGVHGYDQQQKMPDSFLKEWGDTTNDSEDFRMATLEHIRQMPYKVWDYLLTGLLAYDNRNELEKITGNVLVIWSDQDEIFTEADQEELKHGLTNCNVQYITIPNGSHNVHWDSPQTRQKLTSIIDEFIKH